MLLVLFFAMCIVHSLNTGCSTVMIIPKGDPVITLEESDEMDIAGYDAQGRLVNGRGRIPAGYICIPMPKKESQDER